MNLPVNLSVLLFIPLITIIGVILARNTSQVKYISLAGSVLQMLYCFVLLNGFLNERASGNFSPMLFEQQFTWFKPLNIQYYVGVDGISVAMILLTAFVVLAGVLVSWNIGRMMKEFFLLLLLLG